MFCKEFFTSINVRTSLSNNGSENEELGEKEKRESNVTEGDEEEKRWVSGWWCGETKWCSNTEKREWGFTIFQFCIT